ncbi:MAG: DUF1854 domain-containing protein [Clostridiales bacterium]|jgi:hypothetical protein|nr:DUF1854 domain-containing protein [Clostridiales bacterium]
MADDKKKNTVAEENKKTKAAETSKAAGGGDSAATATKTEEKSKSGDNKNTETDTEKKDILDEIDDGDLILQDRRESVPLTPENAIFTRSQGGLISLTLKHDDGKEDEFFERVIVLRAFPITNPEEFISVREPDTKAKGKGQEIGMIRRLSDFDEETVRLIREELNRRYFSPVIKKIYSVKEKFGYSYWESDTTAGRVTFILNNPFSNIRVLEDGRIFINDIDGNSFEIPDPKKLDPASYRKIEMYL